MPKVGSKHFSYDQSGHDKAMKESQRTGLPIENEDKNYAQFAGGGSVDKPMYGKGGSVRGYGKARVPKGKK
jgi:predicted ATP-grasp superfamily ATP-dependent carboligase